MGIGYDDQEWNCDWYSCMIYVPADVLKGLLFDSSTERRKFLDLGAAVTVGGGVTLGVQQLLETVPKFVGWAGGFCTVAGVAIMLKDFAETDIYNDFLDTIQPGGKGTKIYPAYYSVQPGVGRDVPGVPIKGWHRWHDYPRIPRAIDGQLGDLEDRKLDKDDLEDLIPE